MPSIALVYELLSWFGFFVSAAAGNPIPEEVMIVTAGIRTSQLLEFGCLRWLMLPTVIVGAVVADVLLYAIGRLCGAFLERTGILRRIAPPQKQMRIVNSFRRYGIIFFVIGRLIPGIRITMFLTAGTLRLPLGHFVVADLVGALFGITLFFLLGYGLGAQFCEVIEQFDSQISPYKSLFYVGLLLVMMGGLAYLLRQPPIRNLPFPTEDTNV